MRWRILAPASFAWWMNYCSLDETFGLDISRAVAFWSTGWIDSSCTSVVYKLTLAGVPVRARNFGGRMSRRLLQNFAGALASVGLFVLIAIAQTGAKDGEWRTYGADLGNTKYSPLSQIDAANFNKLQLAWRFHTENLGSRPE